MTHKIVLYPDTTSFLKTQPLNDREKVIYEPLNNHLMFTDVMIGSDVGQNGVLDLVYDIVEINVKEKVTRKREREREKEQELKEYSMSGEKRNSRNYSRDKLESPLKN